MTAAAAVFCCLVALALLEGFGAPAFATTIASDAIDGTLPFVGMLVVARFAAMRMPASRRLIERIHVVAQGLVAAMAFGWWWIEPHTLLTSMTGSSLSAMGWQALAGAAGGLALALLSERTASPVVFREVWLAAGVLFLIGGGRLYRAHDHVEAGLRLSTAIAIGAGVAALATLAYLLFRRRERVAAAIPALAPAAACIALAVVASQGGPAELSSRDSILLVVVDTLRADIADGGMGSLLPGNPKRSLLPENSKGGENSERSLLPEGSRNSLPPGGEASRPPPAMPELARIAADGIRFTQAVSPAPWTLPATVSLLSGWNPHRHGFGASVSFWEVTTGDPKALYLAGALRSAGYLSAAFVHNPWLRPYFGFGHDFYSMRPYHGRALDGVALALGWLSDRAEDPAFTMLHLMDPHWPYEAPAGFGDPPRDCPSCSALMFAQYGNPSPVEKDELRSRYTTEVRFTDAMLGRLYDTLVRAGSLDRTWLIVTSDHGEEFWEHGGFLHGHALYDELLRVPLVVVPPKRREGLARGRRIDDQVRLEDVAATMLEIAGLDTAMARDGRSLVPLLEGKPDADTRVEVAGFVKSVEDLSYAVRRPRWKAIVRDGHPDNALFDLIGDPAEKTNLLFPDIRAKGDAKAIGDAFFDLRATPGRLGLVTTRSAPKSTAATPDADTQRNLRSLGYAD